MLDNETQEEFRTFCADVRLTDAVRLKFLLFRAVRRARRDCARICRELEACPELVSREAFAEAIEATIEEETN